VLEPASADVTAARPTTGTRSASQLGRPLGSVRPGREARLRRRRIGAFAWRVG